MRAVQGLAIGAALLGAAAAFAGSPFRPAHAVAQQEQRVAPLQLATWIRARKPNLRVIDVRSPEAFAAYPIPMAENIEPSTLSATPFTDDQTIVVYAQNDADSVQALKALQAAGHGNAKSLVGGLIGWDADVMNATLPANASPEAVAAFKATADLSRYFGGEPHIGPAVSAASPPAGAIMRRRGC